jgi:molybdopterin-binding protein
MLKVDGLSKKLGRLNLQNVSFEVRKGGYFVLLGESGIGKTVILEMIAGLTTPDSGRITVDGRDVTGEPVQKRSIGIVHQDLALFPHMTVRDNIAYPLRSRGEKLETVNRTVNQLADMVGASAFLDRRPGTLSGGEASRVAVARALALRPTVLLLDEPLGSLDASAKASMRALLRRVSAGGQTAAIVHVTHDYEEAMALADTVGVLENGTLSQIGTPDEVFHHPRSRFVADFVGIRNFFKGWILNSKSGLAEFQSEGLEFHVSTESADGAGFLMLRSEDIVVSLEKPSGSARNVFGGTIMDMEPVRLGVELSVDIGVRIFAVVTGKSVEDMKLRIGSRVWTSFKSTAARFLPE